MASFINVVFWIIVGFLLFIFIPYKLIKTLIKPNGQNRLTALLKYSAMWLVVSFGSVIIYNISYDKLDRMAKEAEEQDRIEAIEQAKKDQAKAKRQAEEQAKKDIIEKAKQYQQDRRNQAVAHFKSDKESKVLDAIWTSPSMFKVGVVNDGTNRNGYANYVCQVLRGDFGIDGSLSVEVIDIQALVATDKWVELGRANCN